MDDQEGILPDKQLLFFGSDELENERTFFYYGISDEDRLELLILMPSIPRTGQIQIFIRTLTGKMIPLVVELTDTVISVMQKIHAAEGIPPDQQRLIVMGAQMTEKRLLWPMAFKMIIRSICPSKCAAIKLCGWAAFVSESFPAP